MLEVRNVDVFGIMKSMIASGYAMTTEPFEYDKELGDEFIDRHYPRAERLVKASKNGDIKCHDNFLTGIIVQFDVKYPQYIAPEMQRYHFLQIITSQSKMHRLLKMDIDKSCNEWVSQEAVDNVNRWIDMYNRAAADITDVKTSFPLKLRDGRILNLESKEELMHALFMRVLSDCPLGLEMWMRVTTNYKQLQNIYIQRKNHKLKEDWGAFCSFIEGLPYAKSLILGE